MPKYTNGVVCYRCNKGHIRTNDATQICDWCGRVVWQEPLTIWFRDLMIGERFYSAYHPEDLLIKVSDCHPKYGNNYCLADDPIRGGNCGYAAPCIREHDKTMRGSGFSYN